MIAYIPARSGSFRLKNKNIKLLDNKPVLEIVINNLITLKFIKDVFVSTDSPEIAFIARNSGAKTLKMRSKKLSDHKSGFMDLIKNDIIRYCKFSKDNEVLFVLATSALVPTSIYLDAFNKYKKYKPEVLMPCDKSKPFWSLIKKKNKWIPLFPEYLNINSQNLPDSVIDAGLFYYFNITKLRRYESIKNVNNLMVYNVPSIYSVDVDTKKDWEELELKYKLLKNI